MGHRLVGLLLLFALAAPVLGRDPAIHQVQVQTTDVSLKGIRLKNPGKPPIILQHGFWCNAEQMLQQGQYYFAQGFDVWLFNFPGHGTGALKSTSASAAKGSLGFEKLYMQAVPAQVDFVLGHTGQKPIYIGHSMGGMAALKYAEGFTMGPDGVPVVDPELAKARAGRLRALVTQGTPVHFRELPIELRLLARPVNAVAPRTNWELPAISTPGLLTPDQRGKLAGKLRRALSDVTTAGTVTATPRYMLNPANFTDDELLDFFKHGTSSLSSDLLGDFAYWHLRGFQHPSGLSYETPREVFVPYFAVAGDGDKLAPAKSVIGHMRTREKISKAPVYFAQMLDASHLELSYGKRNIDAFGPAIVEFARDPEKFYAPPATPRFIQPRPGHRLPGVARCVLRVLKKTISRSVPRVQLKAEPHAEP